MTGPLTVTRHTELASNGLHLHELYRGEDVTRRCRFADDTPGRQQAELFKLDAKGHKYVDMETREDATEIVIGDVVIVPGEPL